jgi:hypothetical protein
MADPASATIKLSCPIKHGDEMLYELVVTEPTVEGLMMIDQAKGDIEKGMMGICAVTGLPPVVIKQLRLRDMKAVSEKVLEFLGEDGSETGNGLLPGWPTGSIGSRAS